MSRRRDASDPSLALLSLAVVSLAAGCGTEPGSRVDPGEEPTDPAAGETLFSESPPMWYEAYFADLAVAPGGNRAIFTGRLLLDLTTGREAGPIELDVVFRAQFDTDGTLLVNGRNGAEQGWFRPEAADRGDGPVPLDASLPPHISLTPSPDGDRFAYWTNDDPGTLLTIRRADAAGERPDPDPVALPGPASGLAWLPDGDGVLVHTADEAGVGTLHRVDLATGDATAVATDLDGPSFTRIAVSADGRFAFLALAGPDAPDPEARHDPYADRDLDIWEVDLASGGRRPVVEAPGEQVGPNVVDGALYWVSVETRSEVAIVPMEAGPANGASDTGSSETDSERGGDGAGEIRVVGSDVQIGTWRPDGRALGVTTGNWRLADWALNLDGGVIEIDDEGRPTGPVTAIITGYHEDFSPVWSPDGSWIAYHSHRSRTPVAGYSTEGSSDDIYLRRPEAPDEQEIRLTDFGLEVGNPDWAPDGRRLVMGTWDDGGGSSTWIIQLDPETGAFVDRTRVPQPEGAAGGPSWEAWSPVRDELAITYVDAAGTELWLMAPDGSDARRIASWPGGRYGGVDWSADGETLVYAAPVEGRYRLYTLPRSGGEPRLLAEDEANLLHPRVSPDGRWVAVSRIRHVRRVMRR